MGSKSSKPLAESARNVLARKGPLPPPQILKEIIPPATANVTTPKVSDDIVNHGGLSSEANSSVAYSNEPPKFTESDSQTVSSGSLAPDILAAISKWQVTKRNSQANTVISNHRTITQIRHDLDSALIQGGDENIAPAGRLSELQLHQLYKILRDEPSLPLTSVADQFSITEDVIRTLSESSRLAFIVKDPADPSNSYAE